MSSKHEGIMTRYSSMAKFLYLRVCVYVGYVWYIAPLPPTCSPSSTLSTHSQSDQVLFIPGFTLLFLPKWVDTLRRSEDLGSLFLTPSGKLVAPKYLERRPGTTAFVLVSVVSPSNPAKKDTDCRPSFQPSVCLPCQQCPGTTSREEGCNMTNACA